MVLVGIGANLADANGRLPLETCRWAVGRIDALPGWRVRGLSRWFRTAPVPASDQPDFVNAVVHLVGSGGPGALLAALHGIEAAAGRVRMAVNAARVLDLDLLAYHDLVSAAPELKVPHPRLAQREFVLAPLCDVAPHWRHPWLGTATDLLRRLAPAGAQPLLDGTASIR